MVLLVHKTDNAENLLAYMARVSSPHQDNPEKDKLINYLIQHKHWSPFEMINMCLEITTSRAISQQIVRHRSFTFQEFSQRYTKVDAQSFEFYGARRQDLKNRQNSIDDLPDAIEDWFLAAQIEVNDLSHKLYYEAIDKGIARESARFLLPLSTETKLYMNGTLRSWIHYIQLRTEDSTQFEHREIALEIKRIFVESYPIISKALGWSND